MNLESVRALKQEVLDTTLGKSFAPRLSRQSHSQEWDLNADPIDGAGLALQLSTPSIALGIASDEKDGYRLAVRVQEHSELGGPTVKAITEAAAGEVDLRCTGRPMPAASGGWHRTRCDPLLPGASLGSRPQRTTGTLGCFVEPAGGGELAVLSAAHVLAGWGSGARGDEVIQPGWADRKGGDVIVAELSDMVELRSKALEEDDCALAQVRDDVHSTLVGGLTAVPAQADESVQKDGRTTGHTQGRVLAIDVGPLEVPYPKLGRLLFDNLIEVDGQGQLPFAAQGDSGSIVVAAQQRALGLLFAVTRRGGRNGGGVAYLAPLGRVLQRLQVQLVP